MGGVCIMCVYGPCPVFSPYRWDHTKSKITHAAFSLSILESSFDKKWTFEVSLRNWRKWWRGTPGRGNSLSQGPETRTLILPGRGRRPPWMEGREGGWWPDGALVPRPLSEGPWTHVRVLHVTCTPRPEATQWLMRTRPTAIAANRLCTVQFPQSLHSFPTPPKGFSQPLQVFPDSQGQGDKGIVGDSHSWLFSLFSAPICKRQQEGKMCLWLWPFGAS